MGKQLQNSTFAIIVCGLFAVAIDTTVAQPTTPLAVGAKNDQIATAEQIDQAENDLRRAEDNLGFAQQLNKNGSLSNARLESAQLDFEIARLQLKLLIEPDSAKRWTREIAEKRLSFAQSRFARNERLFQSGSLSELRYRRSAHQVELAKIQVRLASGDISKAAADWLSADQNLKIVTQEFELVEQLYNQRSITKATYQRAQDRVAEAKAAKAEIEKTFKQNQKNIEQRIKT